MAQGVGVEDILDDCPDLELEDIHACIALVSELIEHHPQALEARAIVTIRGGRIRISHYPTVSD